MVFYDLINLDLRLPRVTAAWLSGFAFHGAAMSSVYQCCGLVGQWSGVAAQGSSINSA